MAFLTVKPAYQSKLKIFCDQSEIREHLSSPPSTVHSYNSNRFSRRSHRDHRLLGGMTLVEILVTIGIVVVLATLTIRAYESVMSGASSTRCLSNLRKIHTGFMLYAADHDGRIFPYRKDDPNIKPIDPTSTTTIWVDYLAAQAVNVAPPEMKISGSLYCNPFYTKYRDQAQKRNKLSSGYAMNYNLNDQFSNSGWGSSLGEWRLAGVPTPSKTVLVAEGIQPWIKHAELKNSSSDNEVFGRWHKGSGCVLFVDGHTEQKRDLKVEDLQIVK